MDEQLESCGQCGCNGYHVDARRAAWYGDGELEVRRCDHCGHTWEATVESEEPPATAEATRYCVIFRALRCPYCESKRHHVTKTLKDEPHVPRTRYHRCDVCQKTFKSLEK